MKNKRISSQFSDSNQQSAISLQKLGVGGWELGVKLFILVLTFHFSLFTFHSFSQVGVGINTIGAAADGSALLDASSTTQGALIPRMTTAQRNAITSPANSLLIFNTTTQCFEGYNAGTTTWAAFGCLGGCSVPAQPSAITGTGTVCQSQNGVAYSVTNVSGVTYSWTYSGTGLTIGSGSGTSSITANFSGTATSGTISVSGSNACGSSTAQTFAITVNSLPAQPSVITGTGTVCQSQNGVAYSVTNVSGVTYSWTYSGTGFTIVSGSGSNSITANFSGIAGSGTLSVTGSNACGSSTASTSAITVNSIPTAPTTGTNAPLPTQITWNWNTVSGATGYRYNTVNTYASASDNGASTSYTQTGLTCNTGYTLYVWAYNTCGNSSSATLNQTSAACVCAVNCSGSGNIGTVAGNGIMGFSGDGSQALCAEINAPGVAVDASGNVYIADYGNNRIRKVTVSTGIITTIAGNGTQGYNGDNIAATTAELWSPNGVAVDGSGNVYIADYLNNRVRKVNTSGIITTLAGNGTLGYNGDNIAATAAQLAQPLGVAVDNSGNVYIADWNNIAIRKVTVSTGIITTVAGTPGWYGYTGDNGPATAAKMQDPEGLAVDGSGNIFISDWRSHTIRKVTASTGIITTIAGNNTAGFSGDGGQATAAVLNYPLGVATDASGNVYIGDRNNNRIRKITVSTGIISTIAGNATQGFNSDGIPATNAELNYPFGVAVDISGNVYIGDVFNYRIRKVCK